MAALAGAVTLGSLVACSPGGSSSSGSTTSSTPSTTRRRSATTAPSSAPPSTAPRTLRATVVGPALPQRISRAVAVADGAAVRVLGGRTAAKVSTADIVEWSPGRSAAVVGRLDRRVHDAAGVRLGAAALLFGGGDGGSVAGVQRVGTTGGTTTVGQLPQARSDVSAAVVDGTAYVVGGFDDKTGTNDVLATRDGHTFTRVTTLPAQVRYGALVAVDRRLLVLGGEDANGSTDAVLEIDPAAGTVRRIGTLAQPLSHAAAFVLGGEVYVAGGETGTTRHADIWRYDRRTNRAVPAGTLPDARSDAAVAVVGSTAYLVGGEAPTAVDSVVAVTAS
ncbi:MAG: Kelch repeat type 1-containing protein [Acidimicrobiales bacterium]|nr:Kelch repeat type 1-containing protein [Acidimicrobiales bacterium]